MQKLVSAAAWALAFYAGSLFVAGFICGVLMSVRGEIDFENLISNENYSMVVEGSLAVGAIGGLLGWFGVLPAIRKRG